MSAVRTRITTAVLLEASLSPRSRRSCAAMAEFKLEKFTGPIVATWGKVTDKFKKEKTVTETIAEEVKVVKKGCADCFKCFK